MSSVLPGWLRRIDSLFLRMLLTQFLLVAVLGALFIGLFYVERSRAVAALYAAYWGPHLAAAAGGRAGAQAPLRVLRSTALPANAYAPPPLAPRISALRRDLAAQGVQVGEVMLGNVERRPVLWLHTRLQTPDADPASALGGATHLPAAAFIWLGVEGHLIEADWPQRAAWGFGIMAGVLLLVSWLFAWWLTRPLTQLRDHIMRHQPGHPAFPVPAAGALPGGSPEIAAIGDAYRTLLLRQAQHERERALMLAGVSHDLRSPLGRIRMAAELLADCPQNDLRKQVIVRNVAQADHLIGSFLDYVRAGEIALNEPVDLTAAVRAAAARLEHTPPALTVHAPAPLLCTASNRLLVERLTFNLLDNAFKHGAAPVSVRTGFAETPVAGEHAAAPPAAYIEVQDAGPGMSAELAGALQQPFARGDPARSVPGSGLGLATVVEIARRLGGSVTYSRSDSLFSVRATLPLTPPCEVGTPR